MPEQDRRAEDRTEDVVGAAPKTPGERRRYNRRRPDVDPAPPYYEIFERIASALEGIEREIRSGVVQPPRPREGSERSRRSQEQG